MLNKVILLFFLLFSGTVAGDELIDSFGNFSETNLDVRVYLPVTKAFTSSTRTNETEKTVTVTITPARGYYIYRSRINVKDENGDSIPVELPSGIEHTDDFMGKQIVFYVPVSFDVPSRKNLTVTYQGCTVGMCYPPQHFKIESLKTGTGSKNETLLTEHELKQTDTDMHHLTELPASTVPGGNADMQKNIREAVIFLLIGISLSFTPCVFPMYPILSMLLFGRKTEHQKNRKTFALSCFFVLGIAITYTVIGIVSGYFGAQTHAFLQQKIILIIFSIIFILLSLSMLGLFTIQMPPFIASKLQKIADEQHSGSMTGAFTVGVITSLICSPCTTAPVSASILYTIQAGNLFLGTADLFLLGFGMGIPMLAIGLFGKKILPKAGSWLNLIKQLIGIFSLMVPFILLDRILPHWILPCGIIVLTGCALMLLIYYIKPKKTLVFLPFVIAGGIFSGWYFVDWQGTHHPSLQFIPASSMSQIKDLMSKNPDREVIIDFYASWCASCKQMEVETFASKAVQRAIRDFLLIRVDLSETNDENQKISDHFNIVGLPSILIADQKRDSFLISGFYNSKDFIQELKKLKKTD